MFYQVEKMFLVLNNDWGRGTTFTSSLPYRRKSLFTV